MAKGWRQRLSRGSRGRFGWLGRIEGVEKPAFLVGLGLILYRVWRAGDPNQPVKSGWRSVIARVRRHLTRVVATADASDQPEPPAVPATPDPRAPVPPP
jgi:hypothetical protein